MATDKDAQCGYAYDHSLFIADSKVTTDISRVDLNNAGFIFGKAYTAGGISCTLRASAIGGSPNEKNGNVGDSDNNEWDQIHVKNAGSIKV